MRILTAIMFYPRGGSAHATRALVRGLRARGCEVKLLAGSLSGLGDARAFYDQDVHAVDFDPALASSDPLHYDGPPGTAPLHPSFEDRPRAPDRVFAALDDLDYERQVRAWSRELLHAGAAQADVLYLHHLTPINEAAARVAPVVPVVGHLHGTELLMLEQIERGAPPGWEHAERWAARLREWARRCARLIAVPAGVERAAALLEVAPERILALPSGVDAELFAPQTVDRERFWRHVLVEEPRGWLPGAGPGSARYEPAEAAQLANGTVLLYAGRFTAVKRLDLLIAAFARARRAAGGSAGLVLAGGHPGEWEGRHPADLARELGAPGVFLAGWREQDELPPFFSASDAVVMASEREQFGLVLVEGMACGLPAVAPRALGPASIVTDGRTGWLAPPGDENALAVALEEAVTDPVERRRRGQLARADVVGRFAWPAISAALADCFAAVIRRRERAARARRSL
jgi:glycosyltransferase involved in cell wall biosynthesis